MINQLAQAKTEEMLIELLANSSAASKEEEEDVKIIEIYNGSKIFWYLKETLSLVFYHHAYVNCIEIVAFNPRINRELNRLYINQPVLKNFTLEYIKSMTRVQYKEFSHLAYGVQENINYDRQYNDRLKSNPQSMVTLILSRLSLEEIYGHVLPHLYFRKYAIDPVVETVLFNDRPEALHPISMIRRRWTSVQKFHSKYNAFHTDLLALNVATLRAERLASHLRLGVEAFKAAAKRTGGGGGSEGSVGQLRFRRILRLLAVEETKKALASTNYHQHKTIAAYH